MPNAKLTSLPIATNSELNDNSILYVVPDPAGVAVSKSMTLSQMRIELGAITAATHETLDTLVHSIAETSYQEITRVAGMVTNVTVWASSAKLLKIRETVISYTGGLVSTTIDKQYNGSGVLVQTLTQTYNRTGGQITSIDATET